MAFVFDTTISGTTANSYITISAADDYFAGRYGSDLWAALDEATKEAVIVSATKRIDQESYSGIKTLRPQSLQWPRQYMFDRDGYAIVSTVLPSQLQGAVCELAYYYLERDDYTLSENDMERFKTFEVGPLKVETRQYTSNQLPQVVSDALDSIGYQVRTNQTNSKVFVR